MIAGANTAMKLVPAPSITRLARSVVTSGLNAPSTAPMMIDPPAIRPVTVGSAMPDFTLPVYQGGSVTLSALKANLEPSLALFSDVVLNPSFPAAELERLRQRQLAAIDQEGVQPFAMALRVLPKLLYGAGHAYALPLTGSGTKASVAALTRDQVAGWHQTWFRPGNATLIVAGDTTLAEIRPRLESLFASWKPGSVRLCES